MLLFLVATWLVVISVPQFRHCMGGVSDTFWCEKHGWRRGGVRIRVDALGEISSVKSVRLPILAGGLDSAGREGLLQQVGGERGLKRIRRFCYSRTRRRRSRRAWAAWRGTVG